LMAVVKSFGGLPHRMQTVTSNQQLTWVNDSKATNVGATCSALQSLEQNIIWIAGGQGKDADFGELRDALSSKIKLLIVLGEDAHLISAALAGALPIQHAQNMQHAVEMASEYAKSLQDSHTVVLLSPACASFDMYQSYNERGEDFMLHVRNLKQAKA
jgi:UDP-N-acetylmuramoylalanine--D-glutamate ligase